MNQNIRYLLGLAVALVVVFVNQSDASAWWDDLGSGNFGTNLIIDELYTSNNDQFYIVDHDNTVQGYSNCGESHKFYINHNNKWFKQLYTVALIAKSTKLKVYVEVSCNNDEERYYVNVLNLN